MNKKRKEIIFLQRAIIRIDPPEYNKEKAIEMDLTTNERSTNTNTPE